LCGRYDSLQIAQRQLTSFVIISDFSGEIVQCTARYIFEEYLVELFVGGYNKLGLSQDATRTRMMGQLAN